MIGVFPISPSPRIGISKDSRQRYIPIGIESDDRAMSTKSVGGNPRLLDHGPKIDSGAERPAGFSPGPVAFSLRINRRATTSATTKAYHGACGIVRATLRRLQAIFSNLAYRPLSVS
jgi:hypothetical protein